MWILYIGLALNIFNLGFAIFKQDTDLILAWACSIAWATSAIAGSKGS